MNSETTDFQRYLAAKRSVDARAFNQLVWDALVQHLEREDRSPLRILELGGGIGSLAARILEARLSPQVHYTLVDLDPENTAAARRALEPLAADTSVALDVVTADAYGFLKASAEQGWDLLVAHAFLDLLDLKTAVPRLLASLRPGGFFYFPINYDGLTAFEPAFAPEFEAELLAGYNRSMDERRVDGQPSGDSLTGRHLFAHLAAAGAEVLAAGPSDWLVFPQGGAYPEDEDFFLNFILATIENEMGTKADIDQDRLDAWVRARRAQVSHAELIYLAHQIDFFGRRSR
jgi:SAM-dependent methyltransferase